MTRRPGFIAIPRAVLESEWYRTASPLARNLWLRLLTLANWGTSKTPKGETLGPGQLVTSWKALSERLAWTENNGRRIVPPPSNIRRAAAFLRNAREVTWKAAGFPARTGVLVTLERWALYGERPSSAADVAAENAAEGSATHAATLIQEGSTPCREAGGETLTHKEKKRRAIEETSRILEEERQLREGEGSGTVH